MAQNIEIKARAYDFLQQQKLAEALTDTSPEILPQEDTFFHVDSGRLKLREFPNAPAQLIFYHRSDDSGPKLSDYQITEVNDSAGLKSVLSKANGVRYVVKKIRTLYLSGQTRIHFDKVEKLGNYIELEVVLSDDDSKVYGTALSEQLMRQLKIQQEHLIDVAYVDLLEQAS